MSKIEYKVIEVESHQNNVEDFLNEQGKERWDLIDTFRFADRIKYTFKRNKKVIL